MEIARSQITIRARKMGTMMTALKQAIMMITQSRKGSRSLSAAV
jgi:hypothetical protein